MKLTPTSARMMISAFTPSAPVIADVGTRRVRVRLRRNAFGLRGSSHAPVNCPRPRGADRCAGGSGGHGNRQRSPDRTKISFQPDLTQNEMIDQLGVRYLTAGRKNPYGNRQIER